MKKILFVCTGNICRSSLAEAQLRHIIEKQGWSDRYFIDSCATHDYHTGEKSDIRMVAAAKARGINMSNIRARQITGEDFKNFDHIIAMDQGHLRILNSIAPQNIPAKISLFLDHVGSKAKDVPDPYYGDDAGFEEVLDIFDTEMPKFLNVI